MEKMGWLVGLKCGIFFFPHILAFGIIPKPTYNLNHDNTSEDHE